MKKYKITYYSEGVKKSVIVEAKDKDDALEIAWCLLGVDDVYASEVTE